MIRQVSASIASVGRSSNAAIAQNLAKVSCHEFYGTMVLVGHCPLMFRVCSFPYSISQFSQIQFNIPFLNIVRWYCDREVIVKFNGK